MSSKIRLICKKSKERIYWGSKWIPYQKLPVRNSMTANAYMRDFKASRKKRRGKDQAGPFDKWPRYILGGTCKRGSFT